MRHGGALANKNSPLLLLLRILIAAGLAVDAVIHLQFAANYQFAAPEGIGQGNLFRIQAAAAIIAGLYVLLRGSRTSFVVAAVIALTAVTAVVLYRYVDIPAIGPIPSMYEPVWFFEKTLSAVAEGVAGIFALIGYAVLQRQRRRPRS